MYVIGGRRSFGLSALLGLAVRRENSQDASVQLAVVQVFGPVHGLFLHESDKTESFAFLGLRVCDVCGMVQMCECVFCPYRYG